MTAMLKNGWNPVYLSFYDFVDRTKFTFLEDITGTWYDAYPKASETWGACIYIITNNIEGGKSFNFVSMTATFCIFFGFLYNLTIKS